MDQQALAAAMIWAFLGMVACTALAMREIDKAMHAPKPAPPAAPQPVYSWQFCPSGHCKALAAYPYTCPICQAAMTRHEEQAALWRALEAA